MNPAHDLPGVRRIGPLTWSRSHYTIWFRLFGRGVHATKLKPLFSERHGYTRTVKFRGWRFRWLKKSRLHP